MSFRVELQHFRIDCTYSYLDYNKSGAGKRTDANRNRLKKSICGYDTNSILRNCHHYGT
jgi:hypothetical protein